ncbi:hypothetical protein RvY_12697 [Ramazzottius varieornatus]|uniref:Arrestin C-terminal-like domain-containing protein n=1 Tax=Ramazzottius varieornatus TaxID=947166 RepID=A0A1D1VQT5_RAMVA|nr:hypothetical protein RvY_12697 [Ramazzottius varieornatus]
MRRTTRLQRFDIELLCDQEEYHLGESIAGALVLAPRPGQMISKIRVGIHGLAKVFWSKSGSASRSSSSTSHSDHHKSVSNTIHYFDAEESVYENRRASAPSGPDLLRKIPSRLGLFGPEEFPFVFKLPEKGAPASWVGLYGAIRYWIDATVEVGGGEYFRETISRAVFIMPSPNTVQDPVVAIHKFPLSRLACVTPAAVVASITTSRFTYSPGETVNLTVNVKNPTPWRISSSLCFMEVQTFLGKKGLSKQIKDVLLKINGEIINAHSDSEWVSCLTIPPNAVPSVLDCPIIRNSYKAVLRLRIRSLIPHFGETAIPIVVLSSHQYTPTDAKDLPEDQTNQKEETTELLRPEKPS